MFSWFTGTDDVAKASTAQAPGFHPIALPPAKPVTYTPAPLHIANSSSSSSPPAASFLMLATAPSAAAAATPPEATPSLLFDGMEMTRGRRRRPPPTAPTAPSASPAPPNEDSGHGNGSSTTTSAAVRQDAQEQLPSAPVSVVFETRQRLESFYRHYNPTKLAQVDVILDTYSGKEAQLFDDLVQRYGPEPRSLLPLTPLTTTEGAATEAVMSRTVQPPGESEGSAFRFISPTAETEVRAWAVPHEEEQQEKEEEEERAASSERNAEEAGQEAATPSPPCSAPVAATSHSSAASSSSRSSSSSASSAGSEAFTEHHRRELRVSQGALLEARAALAALLHEAQDALRQRQDDVAHIHTLEVRISECVGAERYREADALTSEVSNTAIDVRRCDAVWSGLGRRVAAAQRQLEDAVRGVAAVLRAHESDLNVQQEAEESAVRSQRSHDDSDLRVREETVLLRQEEISVRRAAAERRLQAAREAQTGVQQRAASALSATRTQRDALTLEVTQLDGKIEELRLQLRQLEERRATARGQLQKASNKLQASEADHASELGEAAATVESCSRDVQRIAQQCSDVQGELARIAEERAAREAAAEALRQAFRDKEEERTAVHRRTRALEQDTIPASDRYWRAWQDFLTSRGRGADVLFEVPAATRPEESLSGAPSAVVRKTDLQTQLEELAGEAAADDELRRDAQRRLEACEERAAPLTAAKTAAVASKNFKAAQQCADELKALQVRRESCQEDVELYSGQVRALERTMERLRRELAAAEAQTQKEAADFRRDYSAVVKAFDEVAADTPDYVQLPKSSQGVDELSDAARGLWAALQREWQGVAALTSPEACPTADTAEGGDVTRRSPSEESTAATEEEEVAAAASAVAVDSTTADAAASLVVERRRQLDALHDQLEDAIAREAFDDCDTIQRAIEELEGQEGPVPLSGDSPAD